MMSRHDLVWLSDLGWQQLIDQLSGQRSSQLIVQPSMTATDDQLEAIKLWQNQDWPLVVRRADADIGVNTDQICLGLAMPPHPLTGEKRRIALRCAVTDIKKTTPALPLSSVIGAAPGEWQQGLAKLALQANNLRLHVFGSLALQTLTKQIYLTTTSDIDVLFYPDNIEQLQTGLLLLSESAKILPLDGEIIFPGDRAVSWKEWLSALDRQAHVLVKEMHTVRLASTASLLSSLGKKSCVKSV
ncbi:malonate decarboxylase holo-[acyl-carrier-protein] synthase [Undibacterium sp. 10I3]|uniref:malonate decarboxylase holo-[acyl-carrier-protein] synthase n=2 Tax=unclassified Undibacterium TaxID=2630295 RepID=UPI002B223ECF|nr:malonate decarboxylase holo-[acyl-carrier-protein] synthase [Undibacterium sp. 10I3]MEB0259154.1 malonate decarboxylase holo-[acyl-carrier-protein] synthase [Undibacterium sp. 5I1]